MIEIKRFGTDEVLIRADDVLGLRDECSHTDLEGAHFEDLELDHFDFSGSNLRDAVFAGCSLNSATFYGSRLHHAIFLGCSLTNSDLSEAGLGTTLFRASVLSGSVFDNAHAHASVFRNCDLQGVEFQNAMIEDAKFDECKLADANFMDCIMGHTVFANCDDLSAGKHLDSVIHTGPSTLDVFTLRNGIQNFPEEFLTGIGYSRDEITRMLDLYGGSDRFFSCFLSHGHVDHEFADHLRKDLIANRVACWHYGYDMQGGRHWRTQIENAIKLHDKLVLICSEESLRRPNVVAEILAAIEREREEGRQKLFPIRLDDFVVSRDALAFADENLTAGAWREDWIRYIQSYHIPDFSDWRNASSYSSRLADLLRDLQEPPSRRVIPVPARNPGHRSG